MSAAPRILAFDTSGPWCGAALLIDGRIVAQRHEEMARGQAERLMPMLEEVLAEEGAVWEELDAIGVGIGPGNFTGIRVGVAAARGLALGLGVPAIGVTGFEVLRHYLADDHPRTVSLLPAPREQIYWENAVQGEITASGLAPSSDFACRAYIDRPALIRVADPLPDFEVYEVGGTRIDCDAPISGLDDFGRKAAPAVAEIALARLASGTSIPRPAPLYIRPADAAPPSDPPPVMLP